LVSKLFSCHHTSGHFAPSLQQSKTFGIKEMGRGRGRGRGRPQANKENDIDTILANMHQKLEEQANMIQNLQQQAGLANPENEELQVDAPEDEKPEVVPEPVVVRQEPLYERFCRMRPAEFEGSTNPLEAEEWLYSIQTILDFMELNDQEKVFCASYMLKREARYWWETVKSRRDVRTMTWEEFVAEFNRKFYNPSAMRALQTEFLNLKQGKMTVAEVVRRFEQLARLCPYIILTEEQRTQRMLDMFRPNIALAIESGGIPPTTVAECIERAFRAEHRLDQIREERGRMFEARSRSGGQGNNYINRAQSQNDGQFKGQSNKRKGNFSESRNTKPQSSKEYAATSACKKCRRTHYGECKQGTNMCFKCGMEGHYARNCIAKPYAEDKQGHNRLQGQQLHAMQVKLEGPGISQGRLEAPEPTARIFTFNKNDAEAMNSNVVT
ncbi:hypothetical protein UlMin_038345, partial [Ulmus minor]